MLKKKNPELAKKLCHRMAQETKDYDGSFAEPVLRTGTHRKPGEQGSHKVRDYVVWEANSKRLAETRAAIAKALSEDK
jgi:hypothetical protein